MLPKDPESGMEMDSKKIRPLIIPGSLGLAVILMSLVLMAVFPSRVSKMPDGFFTPIIAFEFIQDREEVDAFFGTVGSQDYESTIRKMDLGNRVDFLYMILYEMFLMVFSLQAYRISGNRWYLLGMITTLVVIAGDALENDQLLGITSHLSTGDIDQQIGMLRIFTWQKWGGLVVTFLILIPFIRTMNRTGTAAAAAIILSLFLCMTALIHRGVANELFSLSIAAVFLLTIISSFTFTVKEAPV